MHVAGKVEIGGRLDASAKEKDDAASSASGGGIWVTAGGRITILPGAVLKARGGYRCTGAGAPGGGGRIAFCASATDALVEAMAEDGIYHGPGKERNHVVDKTGFLATRPGVTIDVDNGESWGGNYEGSFRFVDATTIGLMLIVR